MRNPNRIPPFVEELGKIWQKSFPDWRFFQFAENFLGYVYDKTKFDPFYIEDEQAIEWVKKFAEEMGNKEG